MLVQTIFCSMHINWYQHDQHHQHIKGLKKTKSAVNILAIKRRAISGSNWYRNGVCLAENDRHILLNITALTIVSWQAWLSSHAHINKRRRIPNELYWSSIRSINRCGNEFAHHTIRDRCSNIGLFVLSTRIQLHANISE